MLGIGAVERNTEREKAGETGSLNEKDIERNREDWL